MKKTPRDLLLARHAEFTPQLNALRHATLIDNAPIPASQLLHALFYPQRRLWLGLATAWLAILAINCTQRPTDPKPNATATLYASNWSANQAQLHALLTETRALR